MDRSYFISIWSPCYLLRPINFCHHICISSTSSSSTYHFLIKIPLHKYFHHRNIHKIHYPHIFYFGHFYNYMSYKLWCNDTHSLTDHQNYNNRHHHYWMSTSHYLCSKIPQTVSLQSIYNLQNRILYSDPTLTHLPNAPLAYRTQCLLIRRM